MRGVALDMPSLNRLVQSTEDQTNTNTSLGPHAYISGLFSFFFSFFFFTHSSIDLINHHFLHASVLPADGKDFGERMRLPAGPGAAWGGRWGWGLGG